MSKMTETLKSWEIGAGLRPKGKAQRPKPADHCEPRIKPTRQVKDRGSLAHQLRGLGAYPRKAGEDLAKRQLAWLTERAKIVDAHRRREAVRDAALRMRATEEIGVDLPEGRKRTRANMTRIKQSEAWRQKQLTPTQRTAETEMQIAWQIRTSGVAPSASRYDGMPGQRDPLAGPESADLEKVWIDWATKANKRKIGLAVVLEVLTEPRTLVEIDTAHRLKRGGAMAIYQAGLDLWAEVRGWGGAYVDQR